MVESTGRPSERFAAAIERYAEQARSFGGNVVVRWHSAGHATISVSVKDDGQREAMDDGGA